METSFEIKKFPNKEPMNFLKFYDSEGVTQMLLRSNLFIKATV